jgi:hypothetical protein
MILAIGLGNETGCARSLKIGLRVSEEATDAFAHDWRTLETPAND